MAYCQPEDVARYTSTITEGADIQGAIAAATLTVESYTRDKFEAAAGTVVATTNRAGVAYLPVTARAITSVSLETGEPLEAGLYTFEAGRNAALRFINGLPYNFSIVGREPWNANRNSAGIRIVIEGDLGHETTPAAVREATAFLAALFLEQTGQAVLSDSRACSPSPLKATPSPTAPPLTEMQQTPRDRSSRTRCWPRTAASTEAGGSNDVRPVAYQPRGRHQPPDDRH